MEGLPINLAWEEFTIISLLLLLLFLIIKGVLRPEREIRDKDETIAELKVANRNLREANTKNAESIKKFAEQGELQTDILAEIRNIGESRGS